MRPQEIRRRAFVLRVWQDETGYVWGQIAEPISQWRRAFASIEELWAILLGCLEVPPTEDTSFSDRTSE